MTTMDLFGNAPAKKVDPLAFLIKHARKMRGKAFSPEEVTLAAMEKGIGFADARSWGPVFIQAAREGISAALLSCSHGRLLTGLCGLGGWASEYQCKII